MEAVRAMRRGERESEEEGGGGGGGGGMAAAEQEAGGGGRRDAEAQEAVAGRERVRAHVGKLLVDDRAPKPRRSRLRQQQHRCSQLAQRP